MTGTEIAEQNRLLLYDSVDQHRNKKERGMMFRLLSLQKKQCEFISDKGFPVYLSKILTGCGVLVSVVLLRVSSAILL